ncbi:5'/3'-nucleotidase SurE [Helicobacter cholecystus]|uniref:5'-nucleotidase SurE n=2 Tax=Helicobacter cholecystus TaxID=45498 RepID=A0A3D8IX86_9HELI|nr:5'/3'-nucleotidase SurE [Helicobacter cholecystus]RDU69525.1 5'/3'-nucleotidase SurE [Helicobacter cholecystus]VEJ24080.1 stationary phase survival protein SurE [Helicobacter cholecystus]
MKTILLTNDDGFNSIGLIALKEALKDIAKVLTIAPACEKSACGHGLTLSKPLKMIEIEKDFYKLDNGTPSDCVYLGLYEFFKDKNPDLVISGINLGSNMGEDITYSGTVAGAMEGAIYGIPSIAISQVLKNDEKQHHNFSLAKECIRHIVKQIFNSSFPLQDRKLLNINIPNLTSKECKGYKITQAGYRIYENSAKKSKNPRGQEYFWLGLHPLKWKEQENAQILSDFQAISQGYISLTPITLNLTSMQDLDKLNEWIK